MPRGRLFNKPVGPSEIPESCFGWNNICTGSLDALCEVCGTVWEGQEPTVSIFLGLQLVEPCCGALLDRVYTESGEEFALQFLHDFAQDPTNPRFYIFRDALPEELQKAKSKLEEVSDKVSQATDLAQEIDSACR